MCGRFAAFSSADEIADRLALSVISQGARLLPANWNVAPTNVIRHITADGILDTAQWGLIPPWAKNQSGLINARVETVAEKPVFANAFANRRCMVPVDGYYEWQKVSGSAKQPWFITGQSKQLYFAGIYNDAGGPDLASVAILTMPTALEIANIHHRMPFSFPASYFDQWFNGSAEQALALLEVADNHFDFWPVSTEGNSVRHNGPHLVCPVNGEITLF